MIVSRLFRRIKCCQTKVQMICLRQTTFLQKFSSRFETFVRNVSFTLVILIRLNQIVMWCFKLKNEMYFTHIKFPSLFSLTIFTISCVFLNCLSCSVTTLHRILWTSDEMFLLSALLGLKPVTDTRNRFTLHCQSFYFEGFTPEGLSAQRAIDGRLNSYAYFDWRLCVSSLTFLCSYAQM